MSSQQLDLSRSWGALRRRRWLVVLVAVAGVALGLGLAAMFPAMATGRALVVLSPPEPSAEGVAPQRDIQTQVLIANSSPVLATAGRQVDPPLRLEVVEDRIAVAAVTQDIVEVRAEGRTPEQAIVLANAVARSYVRYVAEQRATQPKDLRQQDDARVLELATTTTGGNVAVHLAVYGAIGGAAATLVTVVLVLLAARGDRRLRLRDEIADSVGIPVLASLVTRRASDVSGWAELFERYRPNSIDAWNLRKMLRHLGVTAERQVAISVVSFAQDQRALAVGPQIAAFAASLGIVTDLVVETKHEAVASLAAVEPAVLAVWDGPRLRTGDAGADESDETDAALRVQMTVVDRDLPRFAGHRVDGPTLVVISAGRATAEELARVAVAAADDGRVVEGILVADPDPTDRTTGRAPQTRRHAAGQSATAVSGVVRGIRQ